MSCIFKLPLSPIKSGKYLHLSLGNEALAEEALGDRLAELENNHLRRLVREESFYHIGAALLDEHGAVAGCWKKRRVSAFGLVNWLTSRAC